ncbi:uncharacterized protein LOC100835910 [Brachypodium distachyon]|uniref:DUF4228 domain-containing protein n=1 Tax=Brachypodium distachyon TaxID=15368 RepID=I1H6E9_BRADI|nr:uncharacterized protein LOC100835910 [Brachypodium distachyon]KQK22085.1 hypothetical protein BRADI_1g65090v3 [Brachypodium distachyon]|eukprot:XP_003561724.1 uncharacterized protein LOC100835910 [Brachypodium distachyon]
MGNSLRCCLACVLPCGSFDVIRIVHLNGHIEEYSRPLTAGDVMAAHPSHVVSRPCPQGGARRILVVVAPGSELERGCFYFLVPASSVPEKKKKRKPSQQPQSKKGPSSLKPTSVPSASANNKVAQKDGAAGDSYLAEVLSEGKARCVKRGRSVRATVWRPHLQIIPEELAHSA